MGLFSAAKSMLQAAVRKAAGAPISGGWAGGGFQDAWSTRRLPTAWELLQQFKGDVYSCASINASAFATQTLRAYATTGAGETKTKNWSTRKLKKAEVEAVRKMCRDLPAIRKALQVDELTDHPILDLLAKPNPYMDGFKLFELTDLYLEMTGTAYWYKERDALGVPCQLWLIPPTEIYPVRDAYGYTTRYEAVKSRKEIPVEDIVFHSMPDLFAPYSKGKGPAQAAFGQIGLQDKVESYNHATMENRGRPDVFITPKEAMGPGEAARTEARFNRKYRRAGAGGAMVMEQAVDITPAGFSNKDLEMFQLQEASKLNVCNTFSVPISFMKTEDVNRANADAGHYQHAKLAIRPRCMRFAGTLNNQLAGDFDQRLVLCFDDPVPIDVDSELKIRESNLKTGFTVINEEREEEGMSDVEWGDKPWLPINVAQPLSDEEKQAKQDHDLEMAQAQADAANANSNNDGDGNGNGDGGKSDNDGGSDGSGKRDKSIAITLDFLMNPSADSNFEFFAKSMGLTDSQIKCWLREIKIPVPTFIVEKAGTLAHGWEHYKGPGHGRRFPSYGNLKQAMKSLFLRQKKHVLAKLLGKNFADTVRKASVPEDVSLTGWDKIMADETSPIISVFYEDGGDGLNARLGLDKKFDVTAPRIRDAIKQATMKFCDETNKSTSLELDEALDRLRKDLIAGLVSSDNTIAELTKRVAAVFDKASTYRSETIAMSESSRAIHAGQTLAAKDSGLKIVMHWLLSQDACPICQEIAANNEKGVNPGENFGKVGSGPYADVPYPPAHPRCQCTMTEEVVGEKPSTSQGDDDDA